MFPLNNTNIQRKIELNPKKQNRVIDKNNSVSSSTNFGGFTRLVMHTPEHPRPFHSTEEFLKIAGEFKSKTIGKIPKEFLTLFPNEPKKVFQFLDELSILVRGLPQKNLLGVQTIPEIIDLNLISGKKISINYIGKGSFAKAYKINFPEKSYVFKTYRGIYTKKTPWCNRRNQNRNKS